MPGRARQRQEAPQADAGEQNGPTASGLCPLSVPPSSPESHRSGRSEALVSAVPLSCPHADAPRWRASATPPLVGRWCIASSAQVAAAEGVALRLTSGLVLFIEDPPPGFSTRFSTSPRRRYSEHPPRDEYLLTRAGKDIVPVLAALRAWGETHVTPLTRAS
ncbi:winged helix-turn-helix transcriptional regulator [Streptomyces sp. NBC_01518]